MPISPAQSPMMKVSALKTCEILRFEAPIARRIPISFLYRGILGIHAEETVSHELEAVVSLRTLEVRLQIAVFYDGQRIGIQVQGTVLIVNRSEERRVGKECRL